MPSEPTDKRRYSLFSKTLRSCVEPVVRPVIKSKGIATSKLISEWESIVGPKLAKNTFPARLSFARDANANGTLTIACDGAHALELQHMQPLIIERIASYFGYRAVARITIEQRAGQSMKPAKPAKKKPTAKPVNMDCLGAVEDPELKEALSGLAKTFAGHSMKPDSNP